MPLLGSIGSMRATTTRRWCTRFVQYGCGGDRQYFRAQRAADRRRCGDHGWLRPSQGRIVFGGEAIGGMSPDRCSAKAIAFIPEDRRIFATWSVEENLILGLFSRWRSRCENACTRSRVDLFHAARAASPARQTLPAGTADAGDRRALVGAPKLLPWMNRPKPSPMVLNEIFESLAESQRGRRAVARRANVRVQLLSAVPVT